MYYTILKMQISLSLFVLKFFFHRLLLLTFHVVKVKMGKEKVNLSNFIVWAENGTVQLLIISTKHFVQRLLTSNQLNIHSWNLVTMSETCRWSRFQMSFCDWWQPLEDDYWSGPIQNESRCCKRTKCWPFNRFSTLAPNRKTKKSLTK